MGKKLPEELEMQDKECPEKLRLLGQGFREECPSNKRILKPPSQ